MKQPFQNFCYYTWFGKKSEDLKIYAYLGTLNADKKNLLISSFSQKNNILKVSEAVSRRCSVKKVLKIPNFLFFKKNPNLFP